MVTRGTLCIVAVAFLLCAHTIVRSMTGVSRHRRRGTAAESAPAVLHLRDDNDPVVTLPPVAASTQLAGTAPPATTRAPATAACTSGVQFPKLRLNGPAQKLWRCTDGVPAVMLTFGSNSMADFLLNWVDHVRALGERLYLVGALDAQVEALCEKHGIPAATIEPSALLPEEARYITQLGDSARKYFRYAPGTFLRMGLVKQIFIRQMLNARLDAMVSDVDVVWLASPWPLVRYAKDGTPPVRPEAALLALADVVLSVDQVQQYMDSDKYRWHIDSELNTGVIFFRNSPGGVAVLDEWKTSMQSAIRSGNPNHDQFWLNQVLQPRGGPNGFDDLKKDGGARARWLPSQLTHVAGGGNGAAAKLAAAADPKDPKLRAIFRFRKPFKIEGGAGGPYFAQNATPTVGTFPIAQVSNGHTFFVQKLHEIVSVKPVAVHTTYQYGDATTYAYGKRERLRDMKLWARDPPSYYEEGSYLQLLSPIARQTAPDRAELLEQEVIFPEHCVKSHLRVSAMQRQLLQDGFLLAAALGRTLILPPIWCMLDRFWTILNHCLIGNKVEMPQPFVCPLDHSYELPALFDAGLKWREHSFLSHPKVPPALRASAARVRVAPAAGAATEADGTPVAWVKAGSDFSAAAAALREPQWRGKRVLSIEHADVRRLCRCLAGTDPSWKLDDLNRKLAAALAAPFHYCDTTDNPYFVECKSHGRQGCRKHPTYLMNVSRGVQRVAPLPTSGCGAAADGKGCLAWALPDSHITEGVKGRTR